MEGQSREAQSELAALLESLNSTEMGRRSFLAAVPFLLAACASTERSRYREGDNTGQDVSITPEDERRLTAEVLPEMRKEYPQLRDPALQNYVASLGQRLVAANNLDGRPYRYNFSVVDVGYVNAFALPAGTVFITAPLIAMADTEAELMGVIGHEVGHIQARHTAERMAKAKKEEKKGLLYAVGGGLVGAAAGFGIGKLACPPKDSQCLKKAAELGAVAGVGGGLLIQKFAFMANSREDEMEADRIGFRTAVASGYHPSYVGGFYDKLFRMEQDARRQKVPVLGSLQDAMSTHPPSAERVKQMREMANSEHPGPQAITSSNDFDNAKKLAAGHAQRAQSRKQKG